MHCSRSGPMMTARAGVMKALNRHVERWAKDRVYPHRRPDGMSLAPALPKTRVIFTCPNDVAIVEFRSPPATLLT